MESVGWADLNILNSCDCHPGKVRVGSRGGRSYCFQGCFGYSGLSFSFFTTNLVSVIRLATIILFSL